MPSFPRKRESRLLKSGSMEKQPAVYLLAHRRNGVLYVGVTSDLIARTWQHRTHSVDGFTAKYNVAMLVWYEIYDTMYPAITREKQIKKWRRAWKVELIEKENPEWLDLWARIIGEDDRKTRFPLSRE